MLPIFDEMVARYNREQGTTIPATREERIDSMATVNTFFLNDSAFNEQKSATIELFWRQCLEKYPVDHARLCCLRSIFREKSTVQNYTQAFIDESLLLGEYLGLLSQRRLGYFEPTSLGIDYLLYSPQ